MQRPRDKETQRLGKAATGWCTRPGSVWWEVWLESKPWRSLSGKPRVLDFGLEVPELTRALERAWDSSSCILERSHWLQWGEQTRAGTGRPSEDWCEHTVTLAHWSDAKGAGLESEVCRGHDSNVSNGRVPGAAPGRGSEWMWEMEREERASAMHIHPTLSLWVGGKSKSNTWRWTWQIKAGHYQLPWRAAAGGKLSTWLLHCQTAAELPNLLISLLPGYPHWPDPRSLCHVRALSWWAFVRQT